jgi:hypothetical protein
MTEIAQDIVRVRVLPDGRLDRRNAALFLGRSPKTLAQWALQGKGPRSHDIGGRAFYYLDECRAYVAAESHGPSPEPSVPPARRPASRARRRK